MICLIMKWFEIQIIAHKMDLSGSNCENGMERQIQRLLSMKIPLKH